MRLVRRRIYDKVRRNWRIPPNSQQLRCTLRIRIASNGEVMDISISQSSGNPIFDTSSEHAVRRSSPLPVPRDRRLFDEYLTLIFDPNDI
ncbi:hypothetical protein TI04_11390 [Achromatium sp. WMS2]|nr:hypothetical protein TI04_11390 [Achromatium sp. WMS2]